MFIGLFIFMCDALMNKIFIGIVSLFILDIAA